MKNEIKHGQIGSPFEACPYDVSASSGDGQKGGLETPPFGQWKQAPGEVPYTTGANIPYSGDGQLETPMDDKNASIGVSGSSGTGAKGQGGVSSPYVAPWALKG